MVKFQPMQGSNTFDALAALDRDVSEERARTFLRVRDAGNIEALLEMMAPTVIAEPWLPHRTLGARNMCEGKSAVGAMLHLRHREFESLGSTIHQVVAEAGYVVVRRSARLRHRGTSASGTFVAVDILRFRDGMSVELAEYTDTAALERLSADRQPAF